MQGQLAQSPRAQQALKLIQKLQMLLVQQLESLSSESSSTTSISNFSTIEWLRDNGQHGGGIRYVAQESATFNRASVNLSQVHYEDEPRKKLASATALSTIMHPQNPYAPSLHMHISWTELKTGQGYWRLMADLNPAIPDRSQQERFENCLRQACPEHYSEAKAQGERYFYIPALQRHRGVAHFYLESFCSDHQEADRRLAQKLGEAVIELYPNLIREAQAAHPEPDSAAQATQLDYHSLYFLQVLTLDRGTTSGLLVHNQNDVGILGSLPARINREQIQLWSKLLPRPQDQLLQSLLEVLPSEHPCPISEDSKVKLAQIIRAHYQEHPEALNLQASGAIVPPTVANHQEQK